MVAEAEPPALMTVDTAPLEPLRLFRRSPPNRGTLPNSLSGGPRLRQGPFHCGPEPRPMERDRMRERPDRISCAVATANGFAMQIPSSQTTSGAAQNQGSVPSERGRSNQVAKVSALTDQQKRTELTR
jgi:hypothetical protein